MTKKSKPSPLELFLDSEEFDAAMYAYRTAPSHDQAVVIAQFDCVKRMILKAVSATPKDTRTTKSEKTLRALDTHDDSGTS